MRRDGEMEGDEKRMHKQKKEEREQSGAQPSQPRQAGKL